MTSRTRSRSRHAHRASTRFVSVFAAFHARRSTLGRVIQYELRGLDPEQFREIAQLRQRFEDLIRAELEAGIAAGEFAVEDVESTGVAILSLCIDVARWHGALRDRLGAGRARHAVRRPRHQDDPRLNAIRSRHHAGGSASEAALRRLARARSDALALRSAR